MLTDLGKTLRKIRIDNAELLKDMAQKVGMSPAMLSSIENGNRRPPSDFVSRMEKAYALTGNQRSELIDALCKVQETVTIGISGMPIGDQRLAFSFARRFEELDAQDKNEIMRILGKDADE